MSRRTGDDVGFASPPRQISGRAAASLAWCLAFAYSFAPFDFTLSVPKGAETVPLDGFMRPERSLLLHVLACAAVGVADRVGSRSGRHGLPVSLAPLLRGALFCVVIELAQLLLPSRHARLADLAANLTGLLLGHLCADRIARVGAQLGPVVRARLQPIALRFGLLLVWGGLWSTIVLLPSQLAALNDWDEHYPLLIGNEKGGERPWQGELQYLAIYERSLSADDVRSIRAVPAGASPTTLERRTLGLAVAYDFTHVARWDVGPEGALTAPELHIAVPRTSRWSVHQAPALVVDRGAMLISAGPAGRLSERIASTGAFSVEMWLRSADLGQRGPARIVGISDGVWRRNFTIAQAGKAIDFRVRNRLNGLNGTSFALRSPDILLSDELVQIVATYERGISTIYSNGSRSGPPVDLREPSIMLQLGQNLAAGMATALLAALSLVLAASGLAREMSAGRAVFRLLLTGYGWLLIPLGLSAVWPGSVATSLYVFFGPALVVSWVWCAAPATLVTRNSSKS